MCGRYTHRFTWSEIHRLATLTTPQLDFEDSYNVAPTQRAPVVRQVGGERRLDLLRWGLVPFWAGDAKIGNKLINARAESAAVKPAFRAAFRSRRCLVPASGFYEWRKLDGGKRKQRYHIGLASGEPLFFAGLWERWDKGGEPLESYTILTTAANELIAPIHDRMPVILDPSDFSAWLSPETPADALTELLRPCPPELLLHHPD